MFVPNLTYPKTLDSLLLLYSTSSTNRVRLMIACLLRLIHRFCRNTLSSACRLAIKSRHSCSTRLFKLLFSCSFWIEYLNFLISFCFDELNPSIFSFFSVFCWRQRNQNIGDSFWSKIYTKRRVFFLCNCNSDKPK